MSEEVALAIGDLAELSRQIGEQNTTIGYQDAMLAELRRALDVAMVENDGWHTAAQQLNARNHEAWTLVGQCDYFLQTMDAQPAAARRQMAAKLRKRIKEATTPKASTE